MRRQAVSRGSDVNIRHEDIEALLRVADYFTDPAPDQAALDAARAEGEAIGIERCVEAVAHSDLLYPRCAETAKMLRALSPAAPALHPEPKPEPEPVEFDVGDTVTRAGREAVVSSPNGNLAVIKITYYDGTWELVAASDCKLLFSHGEARPVRGSSTGA